MLSTFENQTVAKRLPPAHCVVCMERVSNEVGWPFDKG